MTRQTNFVAPLRVEPDVTIPDGIWSPMAVSDTSTAWVSPSSPTRDAVSATDRARAFVIRSTPVYVVVGLVSLAVLVAYTLVSLAIGVSAPYMLDRVLVFFVMLAAGLFAVHDRADQRDLDHSVSGIERLRIVTAGEVRQAEIAAELELRRAALDAGLRLLERRNRTPDKLIGVDND